MRSHVIRYTSQAYIFEPYETIVYLYIMYILNYYIFYPYVIYSIYFSN